MVVTVLIVHLLVCIGGGWHRSGVMAVAAACSSVSQGSHPLIRFLMTKYEPSDLIPRNHQSPLGVIQHRALDENWNLPISASFSLGMMEYSSQQILSLYQID